MTLWRQIHCDLGSRRRHRVESTPVTTSVGQKAREGARLIQG